MLYCFGVIELRSKQKGIGMFQFYSRVFYPATVIVALVGLYVIFF